LICASSVHSLLELHEFVALLGLDVDESEVEGDVWVLHQHTFHLGRVVVLGLKKRFRRWHFLEEHDFLWGNVLLLLIEDAHVDVLGVLGVEVTGLHECGGIRNSSVGNIHLLDTPVLDVLGIRDPLLLASDEWLRGWEAWSTKLSAVSGIAIGIETLREGL